MWSSLCSSNLKISLESTTTIDMEDMDTEESAPDPHVALRKQLDVLVKDSQVLHSLQFLTLSA